MPLDIFWYDEPRIFDCYMKAYNNKRETDAWLFGISMLESLQVAVNNIMPAAVSNGFNGKQPKHMDYPKEPRRFFTQKTPSKPKEETYFEEFNKWA